MCGITGTVQSVLGEFRLEVSVPNPKHKTISGFVCVTVNGKMAKYNKLYVIHPLYNKHDIEQLKAFLDKTVSSGHSNLKILNERVHKSHPAWTYYKQYDKVENWIECSGASFKKREHFLVISGEEDYDRRLWDLHIPYHPSLGSGPIAGELKLVNCSELQFVYIPNEALTSIDLKGAKSNLTIRCDNNSLTSLTVSDLLSFKPSPYGGLYTGSTINPQKKGALTTTDGLHYTLARP